MKIIIFLCLISGLLSVQANDDKVVDVDLPYLIIPPIDLPDRFKEFERQQINKIVLKGCAKQASYQVIIGDPPSHKKTKWQIFRVDVGVKYDEVEKTFDIEASFVDARKEKVFNTILETKIPELEFYRRLELIIDRLFQTPINYTENNQDLASEKPAKTKPEIVIPESEQQTANINFRERIMDLKTEVNLALAKANQVKEMKKKADAGKNADNNNKKNTTNNNNATDGMVNNPLNENIVKKPNPNLPLDLGHSIRLGYYTINTISEHYIDTTSHPKYLLFDYEFARQWSYKSNFFHHFNLRYGKTLNKEEKEFAPYTGFAILEGFFVERFKWMPKIGLEADTISFKNLPVPGQGLKIANNQIFWFNMSSVNAFKIFNQGFRFHVAYSVPLMVKSGYKPMDGASLSGSKMNFTFAILDLYKKFHFEVNYFTSSLQAPTSPKTITFSTTGVGFNAFYNF